MKKNYFILFLILFLGSTIVISHPLTTVKAQTKTIYYFDASSYYLGRFGYCVIAGNPCHNSPNSGPDLPNSGWGGLDQNKMIDNFDRLMTLTSLQGLVNRDGPVLWIKMNTSSRHDDFYWGKFRESGQPYGLLAGYNVVTLHSFEEVLDTFKNNSNIHGSVEFQIGDNGAGLDVATTVAGADGLVINRQGSSIYNTVAQRFPLKVTVPYNRSKKSTYQWAIDNYIKTDKTNPKILGYIQDAWPLVLYQHNVIGPAKSPDFARDFLIQNKAFIFDLSPWPGERPVDDLSQNCNDDESAFRSVLQETRNALDRQNIKDKTIDVIGFIHWEYKYFVNGDNISCPGGPSQDIYTGAAATFVEEKFIKLLSEYGAYNGGYVGDLYDAISSNLSIMHWGNYPNTFSNPSGLTKDQIIAKGYIDSQNHVANKTFVLPYFGDYEGAIPLVDSFWPLPWSERYRDDGSEVSIPRVWGVAPTFLAELPGLASYLNSTRTGNDYFSGGMGGPGYIYPNVINPDILSWWTKHSGYAYSMLNLSFTPFMAPSGNHDIQMPSSAVAQSYSKFSPNGVGILWYAPFGGTHSLFNNMPQELMESPGTAAGDSSLIIANSLDNEWNALPGAMPKSLIHRNVFYGPKEFEAGFNQEKSRHPERNYEVVDPYTFFYLLRLQLGGNNDNKASFLIDDNFPTTMTAGQQYTVKIRARNDGWNSWYGNGHPNCSPPGQPWKAGCFRLGAGFSTELPEPVIGELSKFDYNLRAELDQPEVAPGQSYDYTLTITAPSTPGDYYLRADVVNEMAYWFETVGNVPFIRKISVIFSPTLTPTPPLYSCNRCSTTYDYCHMNYQSTDLSCLNIIQSSISYSLDCDCPVWGSNANCPGVNTTSCNPTPIPPTSTPILPPTGTPPSPTPTPIPGDITGLSGVPDGVVNIYDYNKLIGDFGKTGSPGFTPSDIDGNGIVDIYDYNTLIGNFGRGNK